MNATDDLISVKLELARHAMLKVRNLTDMVRRLVLLIALSCRYSFEQ